MGQWLDKQSFLYRLNFRLGQLTEEYRKIKQAASARYRKKPTSRAKLRESYARWRTTNPNSTKAHKAHQAVRRALRKGSLVRPDRCSECFTVCKPHGHHESYAPEHWLDVIWLCVRCHRKRDATVQERDAHGAFRQKDNS